MKLKTTQVKPYRDQAVINQEHKCGLCKLPITEDERVHLDHCHKNGWVRGALHARCNTMLSKVENNAKRMGFRTDDELKAFLEGVYDYLKYHEQDRTQVLHPTHLTPEERQQRNKARAKAKRAKAKAEAKDSKT